MEEVLNCSFCGKERNECIVLICSKITDAVICERCAVDCLKSIKKLVTEPQKTPPPPPKKKKDNPQ